VNELLIQLQRGLFGFDGDPHDFTDTTRADYRAMLVLLAAVVPVALVFYGWALFRLIVAVV
jgi:hypothetical protein